MNYSVPWTPQLKGKVLQPTEGLVFAGRFQTAPKKKDLPDVSWSVESQAGELESVADAPRESLLETVLHLWRLKELEGEEGKTEGWRNYLEAWLVRRKLS